MVAGGGDHDDIRCEANVRTRYNTNLRHATASQRIRRDSHAKVQLVRSQNVCDVYARRSAASLSKAGYDRKRSAERTEHLAGMYTVSWIHGMKILIE